MKKFSLLMVITFAFLQTANAGEFFRAPIIDPDGWAIDSSGRVTTSAKSWKWTPGDKVDQYLYLDPAKIQINSLIQIEKEKDSIKFISQSYKGKLGYADGPQEFKVTGFYKNGAIASITHCNGYGNCMTANKSVCTRIANTDYMETFSEGKKSKNFEEMHSKMAYCYGMLEGSLSDAEMASLKETENQSAQKIDSLQGKTFSLWQTAKGDLDVHSTSKFFSANPDQTRLRKYLTLVRLCAVQYGDKSAIEEVKDGYRIQVAPVNIEK